MYSYEDIPRPVCQKCVIQIWNQPCKSPTSTLLCFLLGLCVWIPHIINGLITELSVFLPACFTFTPIAFSHLTIRPTIDSSLRNKPSVKVQQFCHRVHTHTHILYLTAETTAFSNLPDLQLLCAALWRDDAASGCSAATVDLRSVPSELTQLDFSQDPV